MQEHGINDLPVVVQGQCVGDGPPGATRQDTVIGHDPHGKQGQDEPPQDSWAEQQGHGPARVAVQETQKMSAQGLHGTLLTLLICLRHASRCLHRRATGHLGWSPERSHGPARRREDRSPGYWRPADRHTALWRPGPPSHSRWYWYWPLLHQCVAYS